MHKVVASVLVVVSLILSGPAGACRVVQPVLGQTDRYEAVFLGEVTGIRLRGYENAELGKPDACLETDDGQEPICFNITSDTLVSIYALPRVVVQGEVTGVLELDEAGCNKSNLELGDRGIFFLNQGRGSAAIVWESQENYQVWAKHLGFESNAR